MLDCKQFEKKEEPSLLKPSINIKVGILPAMLIKQVKPNLSHAKNIMLINDTPKGNFFRDI